MTVRQPAYLGGLEGTGAAGPPDPRLRQGQGDGGREPFGPGGPPGLAPAGPSPGEPVMRGGRSAAPTFHVAGFWRRLAAGIIDLALLAPVMLFLTWLAAVVTGIELPPANHRGLDFWLDMILAREPALVGGLGLAAAIALIYLFLFQATTGRTLGMRALRVRVIDLYGDAPSIARSAARTAAYLASAVTFGLGFFWIGFDSEKRALHDWLAGTYVVIADAARGRAP